MSQQASVQPSQMHKIGGLTGALLVANAEIDGTPGLGLRCRRGRIVEIGPGLAAAPGETILDAVGGVLLPGLHDHHIHLLSLAAAARSVRCGPPDVSNLEQLKSALEAAPGEDWIRGIGYHESIAGELDQAALDALRADRPVRIQHRSGKMWFLNSIALRRLGIDAPNGRLFRGDELLRDRLLEDADLAPAVEATSRRLASYGITGLTETTHTNDRRTAGFFRRLNLCQHVNLMGDDSLDVGPLKIMLDDAALPTFDSFRDRMVRAHERSRPVAVHCVTRTELIFSLVAFRDAGIISGDRIEHAAVADAAAMALFQESSLDAACLTVVTQPNFIAERGDDYLRDVPSADHAHLYRCRGFLDAGIPLGGGTDAPFGNPDPWAAMQAAVHRRTVAGRAIGTTEALTPEQSLALFTTPLDDPGGTTRRIEVGAPADLCVLGRAWGEVRSSLNVSDVVATVREGATTYDCSD